MSRHFSRHTRKRIFNIVIMLFTGTVAVMFLLPTVLTIANSFMTSNEITANYGAMLSNMTDDKKIFISENALLLPPSI